MTERLIERIQKIKNKYPKGTRIKLIKMAEDEPQPVAPYTLGTVSWVDDIGNIHMHWDNGRALALIEDADNFEIIK